MQDIEPPELRSTEVFKRLIAGEFVGAQQKHKPAFVRNSTRFTFSASEIPSTRDTSSSSGGS